MASHGKAKKPRRFEYRAVDAHDPAPDQWYVHIPPKHWFAPGARLGDICFWGGKEDAGDRGWGGRAKGDDAFHGPFETRQGAVDLLWKRHLAALDTVGQSALTASMQNDPPALPGKPVNPVPPGEAEPPVSEFRTLAKRAGLSIAEATRLCAPAANPKTGRRWAKGFDFDGTPVRLPPHVLRTMRILATENERAVALEAQGFAGPRPRLEELRAEALIGTYERRQARKAAGARDDSRGSGHAARRKAARTAPQGAAEAAAAGGGG